MDLAIYCDLVKSADEPVVCGYVTSGAVDAGGHIVDPDWIKNALPPWVRRWGNVRAQHRADTAAGVADADSLRFDGDKPYIELKIIDPSEVKKVNAGVYKGISIGVQKPIFKADPLAPKGRIVGGDIIEISLVDRPANPDAVITLIKSLGGGEWKDMQSGAVLSPEGMAAGMAAAEKDPPPGSPLYERERLLKMMASQGEQSALATMVAEAEPNHTFGAKPAVEAPAGWQPRNIEELQRMQAAAASSSSTPSAAYSGMSPDVAKREFSSGERADAADSGEAMPDGSYPIKNRSDLENAVQAFGRAKNPDATKAHIRKRAKALGCEDCLPDSWGTAKADSTKQATLDQGDVVNVQSGNSRRSHESHAHPFDGTHNHVHGHEHPYSGRTVLHTHAHDHQDDDIHGDMHQGSSHAAMVMKAADGVNADRVVAHIVQFPGEPPKQAVAVPDALKAVQAATASVAKAAGDFDANFGQDNPREAPRPSRLEDTTTTSPSYPREPVEVASRIESLANQTDQDRDGDIDGMAAQDKTGSEQKAGAESAPSGASAGSLISPSSLELTFAKHRAELIALVVADKAFTAYVNTLVTVALEKAISGNEAITKVAQADKTAQSIPQIAKMAGDLAVGVKALADFTGQMHGSLEGVKADVTKAMLAVSSLAKDVEAVKALAQPEKGAGLGTAAMVVSKGFMLDPVTFQAASAADQAASFESIVKDPKVAAMALMSMSEADRVALAVKMLGGSTPARR